MRQDRLSKTNIILYVCGIIPVIWLGVLIAPGLTGGLPGMLKYLTEAISKPFALTVCGNTVKTVMILLMIYAVAIILYATSSRNYRPHEEHGSAKWGSESRLRIYRDHGDPCNAKILTQNVSVSMNERQHRHNLNVMVVGGSGAGKTRFYAKPNVLQASCSMVILDPNGYNLGG